MKMIREKLKMKIQVQENKMKYFKQYLIPINLIILGMVNWSCDERVPDETSSSSNATLSVTEAVVISEVDPVTVGEVVSGFSKIRIVALLKDADDKVIKDGVVTFACDQGGSFDVTSPTTDESGLVYVIFNPSDDTEAVDKTSTQSTFEGATITAKYVDDVTTSFRFDIYNEIEDVWPYIMNISTDVNAIQLDNGVTSANIEVQLFNKNFKTVNNVILSFSSDKGFIEPEGTTDSTGKVTMIFQDTGSQEDIGLANIIASFDHPGFNSAITDSIQITIGTDNGLTLEVIPVAYDATGSIVIVGEDVVGSPAVTLLVATVKDTAGNPIAGTPVVFLVTSGSNAVGTVTYQNTISNTNGQVVAYFDDNGTVYTDNPGTPNYEGVTVIASFGDYITNPELFNVYAEGDVWPYTLIVNTDTDVIQLDGGIAANITTRLLNALGNPIKNAQISYTSTLGFITATGYTDSTGIDSATFTDLGNPDDIGVSDIVSTFSHPGFSSQSIQDSLQIYIEDTSFQTCAYMIIPASAPGKIVVRDGGGVESTLIKAEVYDDNGNLINTPTPVVFTLNPFVGDAYLDVVGQTTATAFTVNGIASVSINSGTIPGPVRVEVTCDCDQDGTIDLNSVAVPVIIASGPPYHIEAEYDPQSTETIGGGFYRTECAAIISDRWYNPVEDSTYVYWNIDPIAPDTLIDAFVEGVSFTNNEGVISGEAISGVARSSIVYSTDAIGDIGRVRALTFGAGGDSIYVHINEDEGDAALFFLPGQVMLLANATYWDFTFNPDPATIILTAIVTDYYGNAVVDAPISFTGTGVSAWAELGLEVYTDEGVDGAGVGDGCFTWRDYGYDDNPATSDWGNFNDHHDAWDVNNDGTWTIEDDIAEVSEPFDDYGLDGVDGTADEGEGNGEWDGYSMIGCEAIVNTDQDGYARIIVQFDKAICTLANEDEDSGLCTWDDFTATLSATLMIPQITASDPIDILLVRSQDTCDQ